MHHAGRTALLVARAARVQAAVFHLAHKGIYVEYTSAVTWAALKQLIQHSADLPDPVVLVLTGSGLKNL